DHVPERLGLAREEKDVGRGIVRGELLCDEGPGEDKVGMAFLQRGPLRPVPDEDESSRSTDPLHRAVRLDGELQVLLRRDSPDIERDDVVLRRPPRPLAMLYTGAPA